MTILFITLFGFILRLLSINQSFWLDEGASIEIASRPFLQLISSSASDFHPPLFYVLLKYWLPYSFQSEWLIRLPFVIISTLAIYLTYLLSLEIFTFKDKRLYIIPALLLALNPFHIYYSQELRMYGLNTTLTLFTWLFLLRSSKKNNSSNLIWFTLFTTLNLYIFYGSFFNLLAQFIYILLQKKNRLPLILSLVTSIFLFLPWLPILFSQLEAGNYLTTALPGWSAVSGRLTFKDLLLIPTKFLIGRISFTPKILYAAITVISICLATYLLVKSALKKYLSLWLYFAVPLICAIIIGLKTPVLGYWRYVSLVPAFILLLVVGVSQLSLFKQKISLGYFLLLFVICNIIFWRTPSFQRENWKELTTFLNTPNSLIVFNFTGRFAPLNYYLPHANYYPSQKALGQLRPDLAADLATAIKGKDTIYYLDYLSDLTDPSRTTLVTLKNLAVIEVSEKSFIGLGKVVVFKSVK